MPPSDTRFFRDRHPFDALADVVIPSLMVARRDVRRLGIWSAGCSTGQETYSLAMLMRDKFVELSEWQITIAGTDIAGEAIAQARTGGYTQIEVNHGLPARYLARYFLKTKDERWTVRPEIREMVHFETSDLADPPPGMPTFDVVLLRNVLIYFAQASRRGVLQGILRRMAPDGYLCVGANEAELLPREMVELRTVGRAHFFQLTGVPA